MRLEPRRNEEHEERAVVGGRWLVVGYSLTPDTRHLTPALLRALRALRGESSFLFRLTFFFLLITFVSAQTVNKIGTAAISGKVMMDGKPAADVVVILGRDEHVLPHQVIPPSRTTTDANGQYRFTGLATGKYFVNVAAQGYINTKRQNDWDAGSTIAVNDGESIESMDFALVKAGVITGRVRDEQGHPVINESIALYRVEDGGKKVRTGCRRETDDRGVYRCYNLQPGKYIVGAGKDDKSKEENDGFYGARSSYARSWFPNTSEEEKAQTIELSPGGEVPDIDLRLMRRKKGVKVTGRVIAVDTSRPFANAQVVYSKVNAEGKVQGYNASNDSQTNADGEFRVLNLMPGKYKLTPMTPALGEGSEYYGESLTIEVSEEDVSNIELKMEKGSVVSGVAVLEDPSNREAARKFATLMLMIFPKGEGGWQGPPSIGRLRDDGSFQMKGVRPGQMGIQLGNYAPEMKGFSITRMERDGVPINDGIEVKAGESTTGLRITIGYGSGTIRGELKLEGGALPEGVGLHLRVGRSGATNNLNWIEVDARNRFIVEGLTSGTYEITVETHATRPPWESPTFKLQGIKQTVEVTNGQEAKTTIAVDLKGGK